MSETTYTYSIAVQGGDDRAAGQGVRNLADELREIRGVLEVTRRKEEESTMDLGSIVDVVVKSGAAVAIAGGIADWIRRHRGIHLTISRDANSGSIKAEIENADAATALSITEMVVKKDAEPS
jgi:hypothetical protein